MRLQTSTCAQADYNIINLVPLFLEIFIKNIFWNTLETGHTFEFIEIWPVLGSSIFVYEFKLFSSTSVTYFERDQFRNRLADTKINIKDGVPSNYSLVYRTSMENYVEPSKYVAIGGAVLSAAILPVLVLDPGRLFQASSGQFYLTSSFEVWGFWFMVLAHCLACFKISHSVPLRIYHNQKEDNFLFIFNHKFHLYKKEIVRVGSGQLEECPAENDIWREVFNLHWLYSLFH